MSDRGIDYDARFAQLAEDGLYLYGEADLVDRLLGGPPATVVDAGCGTGRVAIELARRGYTTVGLDIDPQMLAAAKTKAPQLRWLLADLAAVDATSTPVPAGGADLVVAAGNVMIFLQPDTLDDVVGNLARLLRPGGLLVAGFSLTMTRPLGAAVGHAGQPHTISLATYDAACAEAGLDLRQRLATWNGEAFHDSPYAVSIHSRPATSSTDSSTPSDVVVSPLGADIPIDVKMQGQAPHAR
jgi:SAM-dependent methyltransferase